MVLFRLPKQVKLAFCGNLNKTKKMENQTLLPKDVDLNENLLFTGSNFKNSRAETIARNIVFVQKKMNPNKWTPFSLNDYEEVSNHKVGQTEKKALDIFVKGGKIGWNKSIVIDAGYLSKDGKNYSVTGQFIKELSKFCK